MLREYASKILNGEVRVGGQIFPPISDRDFWDKVASSKGAAKVIRQAEEKLNYQWPHMLATQFMEFERTGNRRAWEIPHFDRRETLVALVVAECIENKGRFMDDILNGLVLTCEETYWGLSAHRHGTSNGIPGIDDPYLDIFASDAGFLVAMIAHLFKDKMDKSFYDRAIREVRLRMTDAFLKHDDFWWQAIPRFEGDKRIVNNWNPWVCENLVPVFVLVSPDEEYMRKGLAKTAEVLDIFIDSIPEDGGCDEGAGYWCVSMANALHWFKIATYGNVDVFNEPILKKYGDFYAKMFISPNYQVNFNDCLHKIKAIPRHDMYLFGKNTNNHILCDIASRLLRERNDGMGGLCFSLRDSVLSLYLEEEMVNYNTQAYFEDFNYLERVQVLTAWQDRKNSTGLFLATKGGHNDESHNHNDVGTVTVYANGAPLLIDVGKGTYTKDHFNENRYKIWHNQTSWHNLPEINGIMQCQGKDFYAENVKVQNGDVLTFDVDLQHAWQSTSALNTYHRNTAFDKINGIITVTDSFTFKKESNNVVENLIFSEEPQVSGNTIITDTENGTECKIEWNTDAKVTIEHKDVSDDDTLCEIWKKGVWRARISFDCNEKVVFSYSVRIV